MLKIFTNNMEKLKEVKAIVPNSWIELTSPTEEEIKKVVTETGIEEELLTKLLDDDELPRIEVGNKGILIVIDTPYITDNNHKHKYNTYPIGLIISENHFITISLKDNQLLSDFKENKIKDLNVNKKIKFVIQILTRLAGLYQKELKDIDDDINSKEKTLYKSTNNKQLVNLLNIEKTLVYFYTSLKANDVVLEKLSRGNLITLYDEDKDLLEDAIIENKQAIEMATIYREILTSMTDTYATIISNNLNDVMKFLAGITIVFSVPTMIASFLGMNVPLGKAGESSISFIIIIVVSFVIAGVIAWILKRKNML